MQEIQAGTTDPELDDSDFLHVSAEAVEDAEIDDAKPVVKDEVKVKVEPVSDGDEDTSLMDVDIEEEPQPVDKKYSKKPEAELKLTRRSSRKRTSTTTPNAKNEKSSDVIELSDDGDSIAVITKDKVDKVLKNLSHQHFRHEK